MRKILLLFTFCFTIKAFAQVDTTKWLRAFPITGYMVDLNDSIKVVQVEMPDDINIPEKQIGLAYAYGVYRTEKTDAIFKGYGRCNLVKGAYYYFSIRYNTNNKTLQEGDIIYINIEKKSPVYEDQLIELATHFIELLNVYDKPLYDRYNIFSKWNETDEKALLDSMVADIRFTGKYFLDENPLMNKPVNEGKYKGGNVLSIMTSCEVSDLKDFLDYIIARPRLYAGKQWKISEIFATWLSKGAPMVVDN